MEVNNNDRINHCAYHLMDTANTVHKAIMNHDRRIYYYDIHS